MSVTTVSSIDVACDECVYGIERGEVEFAMNAFVTALADTRTSVSGEEWRRMAATVVAHPAHALMMNDPYTAAAFEKKRGYAGDASTLDFVYRHRAAPPGTARVGERLLQITTDAPIACAVRARTRYLADLVAGVLAISPDATVVSIACGHMRELDMLQHPATSRARIYGFDHDPLTLDELTRAHRGRVAARPASVRQLLAHPDIVPAADLIYAAGLFDYLDERAATLLIQRLQSRLTPDGMLVVTNLTPSNPERAYMEAVMDWWMVYRDEADLKRLADGLPLDARTKALAGGRVSCLELRASR